MNQYWITLALGWVGFLAFTGWCVFSIMKTAHDEDPGCLDLRKH
jgi:hypothetical protein